ncbi:MAG TPA: TIGR02444 family protein [Ramlibacter sp.]|nr:TIGR02444 family protein [Ramlibacter sp.]
MAPPPNPFWRFSLRVYRLPGVEQACLALQDRCGADVNLLLFCGWAGREGRTLDRPTLLSAIACVGDWQSQVVAPLRLARRGLKRQEALGKAGALAPPLRKRFLALELALERIEQSSLAEVALQWKAPARRMPAREAVPANLACYLELLGHPAGHAELAHLGCIAAACAGAPDALN